MSAKPGYTASRTEAGTHAGTHAAESSATSGLDARAQSVLLGLSATLLFVPAGNYSLLYALIGLLLVAWPLSLAERALGHRTKQLGLVEGWRQLTREADALRFWRVIAWSSVLLSVLTLPVMALLAAAYITQGVQTLNTGHANLLGSAALWPTLTVFVLLLGVLRSIRHVPVLFWLVPVLLLLALLVLQMLEHVQAPVLTHLALDIRLPATAALLFGALALGGGAGALYGLGQTDVSTGSLNSTLNGNTAPEKRSRVGMLLAALLYALVFIALQAERFTEFGGLVPVLLAAVVVTLSITTWAQPGLAWARGLKIPTHAAPLLLLIPCTLIAEATYLYVGIDVLPTLVLLLAVWMLLNLFAIALFTGWMMKMSHARKALQLPSEGLYNLWRIAVRWVAPATLLYALYLLMVGL